MSTTSAAAIYPDSTVGDATPDSTVKSASPGPAEQGCSGSDLDPSSEEEDESTEGMLAAALRGMKTETFTGFGSKEFFLNHGDNAITHVKQAFATLAPDLSKHLETNDRERS